MNREILFFSAPWCGPCKQMKTMLSESIKTEMNIKIIDISEDMDLASKHQVMNVPTFVVLENGEEKNRKIGSTTIDGLKVL
jgi:thioredoxin 1